MARRNTEGSGFAALSARFRRCERGQGLGEYGLLLALLSLSAAVGSLMLREDVASLWSTPAVVIASVSPDSVDTGREANTSAALDGVSHVL
jgi:Flp pilus assembly pilin Flp